MSERCPYAKSMTTPCFLRDGEVVVVESAYGMRLCVGCERSVARLERDHGASPPNSNP